MLNVNYRIKDFQCVFICIMMTEIVNKSCQKTKKDATKTCAGGEKVQMVQ